MHKLPSIIFAAFSLVALQACSDQALSPWHTERLHEEYEAGDESIQNFSDYLSMEERLFTELEREVYAQVPTGPEYGLVRYSTGSAADPQRYATNWNRTIELSQEAPRGGVLLLHGMSDSPYSLHAIGEKLATLGYWVVGLRLPGHGTAPSGLKYIKPEDLIAATRLAMTHLAESVGDKPLHMIGYSTGAALARFSIGRPTTR